MENSYDIFRDPNYRFHKLLVLEAIYPDAVRRWIGRISGSILVFTVLLSVVPYLLHTLGNVDLPDLSVPMREGTKSLSGTLAQASLPTEVRFPGVIPVFGGHAMPLDPESRAVNVVLLLSFIIWLLNRMLGWYRNSQYYLVEALLERGKTGAQTPYSTPNFETCDVYWHTRNGDLVGSFSQSSYGRAILHRSGIADQTIGEYLRGRVHVVDFREAFNELRTTFTLFDLSRLLLAKDADFYQFLFQLGIRERELLGAAEWVERDIKRRKQRERWWGKVNLGQSPAFGADFAYGGAFLLGKYGTDISRRAISGGSNFRFVYGNEEIKQLEVVLSRSKEANAIIAGEEGTGKMDVILDFARDIMNGYTNPALAHKRVMALDAKRLIAGMRSKQELETELLRVFTDAAKAGNIILVLEDLPGFIQGGRALDSDVMGLIDPYLRAAEIQFIATADTSAYHEIIEPNASLMQRFETILLKEPPEESLLRILEETAERVERGHPIYFTYPAVVEILKSAENYFSNGVMPDKALDLLDELTPYMLQHGGHLVKKLDVLNFVREKTKIPVGEITGEERDRLMRLEELLKQLVIGQEKALEVISNAMRRSRAGVRNQERPIGSFLFLGPTGVGKTETAKALATVFFGNEHAMSRIDMSEFQGEDGLTRMIGAMGGSPGVLPVMLKEQPYGVLLLDEFEKSNPKVLDLFLQVFDEGMFHDANGKKVNARNTIFIATSNAGAQEIREAIKAGRDLASIEKEIIDQVIASGKYRPELLNRFDGVILFHPLTEEDFRSIAKLMLQKLQKRLREKSINLVVNDALLQAVLYHGVDPDFGARPMTRAVQEFVEEKVAEKIIAGKLYQGSTLEFSPEDFPEVFSGPSQLSQS